MRIKKSVLADALKVLEKVVTANSGNVLSRLVRFLGIGEQIWLATTDGVESVVVEVAGDAEGVGDIAVEYKVLRELVRSTRGCVVEVVGEKVEWPVNDVIPADGLQVELPENFCALLAEVAPVVDRDEVRIPLRGVNLSSRGITVTNGLELIHIPWTNELPAEVNLPFPLVLLTAMPQRIGRLSIWYEGDVQRFRIDVGNLIWSGQSLLGTYPDWRNAIPNDGLLDYSIEFTSEETARLYEHLRQVPDKPPHHAVELNVVENGIEAVPVGISELSVMITGTVVGVRPHAVLVLNRHTLLRMLQQGYRRIRANSDGQVPVVAEGGSGVFVAVPLRIFNPQNKLKEEIKMEEAKIENVQPEGVNVWDELNRCIDELRGKLKGLLDESGSLSRKVKETALQQKQKEREFLLAKRAIERIKMAI